MSTADISTGPHLNHVWKHVLKYEGCAKLTLPLTMDMGELALPLPDEAIPEA